MNTIRAGGNGSGWFRENPDNPHVPGATGSGDTDSGSSKQTFRDKQINSPEFKEWFGNSKVVDKDGKPLVVYHATDTPGFSQFEQQPDGPMGTGGTMGHFGSRDQANKFAGVWRFEDASERDWMERNLPNVTPGVYAVYLSIKNPKRVTDDTMANPWALIAYTAKRQGHDGLVYSNRVEGEGDSWIPFYPSQIKSAIGNSGKFSKADPNISATDLLLSAQQSLRTAVVTAANQLKRGFSETEVRAAFVSTLQTLAVMAGEGWKKELHPRGADGEFVKKAEAHAEKFHQTLMRAEGKPGTGAAVLTPYKDTKGYLTVGWGHRTDSNRVITLDEAKAYFKQDVEKAKAAVKKLPFYGKVEGDKTREAVLTEMVFALGPTGTAKFKKMGEAIEKGDFKEAAAQILDSQVAREQKDRYQRLATGMLLGDEPEMPKVEDYIKTPAPEDKKPDATIEFTLPQKTGSKDMTTSLSVHASTPEEIHDDPIVKAGFPLVAKAVASDLSDIRSVVSKALKQPDAKGVVSVLQKALPKLAKVDPKKTAKAIQQMLVASYAGGLAEAKGETKAVKASEPVKAAMTFNDPLPWKEALDELKDKELLPNDMSSEELSQVDSGIRERSLFSARVYRIQQLQKMQDLMDSVMKGDIDESDFRTQMQDYNESIGYTAPEGKEGTIQDLNSDERLHLILRTNSALIKGRARWDDETSEAALKFWPCQELYRKFTRLVPRESSDHVPDEYWKERWEEEGGTLYDGRMIALKTDPICAAVSDFGVPYGPPGFNSGYRWRPISRDEAEELGVIQPDDDDIDQADIDDFDMNDDLTDIAMEGLGTIFKAALSAFGYIFKGNKLSITG